MSDFRPIANTVSKQFASMSKGELYRVNVNPDTLWETYLASFPPGTNPVFRTRTEHDGSYDRSFIKKVGNVVSIQEDGKLVSVWHTDLPAPYNAVAAKLAELVSSASIKSVFRIKEPTVGMVSNVEKLDDGSTRVWHHFNATIAAKHVTREVDAVVGTINTTVDVFRRGMTEITRESVDIVLDLIESNALYRGDEFKVQLLRYRDLMVRFDTAKSPTEQSLVLWQNYDSPAARVRNTAIGTLLQDLSEGRDLEGAVKSYEQKVAPTNYKRPTALITKAMVESATKTIEELGLETALERRFARLSDISVNNVLWVDGKDRGAMKGGVATLLMKEVKQPTPSADAATDIKIDDFMQAVLPKAVGLELFVANPLASNLVSLTAPVHANAGQLFKWDNGFAWSYNGNITDSIKDKVKAAGGNTGAKLRVSLAWYNSDDLDLHAACPDGHVYFARKSGDTSRVQILDVDMNAGGPRSRTPVENLAWVKPKDGKYQISVNQFSKRETADVGFTLEIENNGKITQYSYNKAVLQGETINAIAFIIKDGAIADLHVHEKQLIGQGISKEHWGISTEQFVRVSTVMNSPNHWDGHQTGNKHWLFMLEGCKNNEPTRGIYNEFLRAGLEDHRKVFEVLGNKTKCEPNNDQLSGLGFSSTKRDSVLAKVTNQTSTRVYNINF